jgi:hypothetical protein
MSDAAIACWDAKYTYQFWRRSPPFHGRPLDGNPATDVDVDWFACGVTPAHPEYVSAIPPSARRPSVLAYFSATTQPSDRFRKASGSWRAFPSFSRAVLELTMPVFSQVSTIAPRAWDGNALGSEVARFVLRHSMRPESEEASK